MKQEEDKFTGLPENAFRELKPGEVYNPLMAPSKSYPEVNIWSVAWGIAMAILFSAAAAYLGLKVGQVFEAAIPIAIIAVGVSGAAKRKNALGENVIIQSIGACSGVIVAGAIFTLPALYHLHHSKKGALYALVSGSLIASIFAVVTNYYFAIPMYVKLYGIPLETILKMGRAVNPFVDSLIDYLLFTVLPFNLIKYGIVSFLTYLVYKKASVALTEIVNRLDR